jgi:hypothetical protein
VQSCPVFHATPNKAQFAAMYNLDQKLEVPCSLTLPLTLLQIRRFKNEVRRFPSKFKRYLAHSEWLTFEQAVGLTFFRLELAAAAIIFLPVTVEPVKAILSTSQCAARAAPPTAPRDVTVFRTPAGNLEQPLSDAVSEDGKNSPCLCSQLVQFLREEI